MVSAPVKKFLIAVLRCTDESAAETMASRGSHSATACAWRQKATCELLLFGRANRRLEVRVVCELLGVDDGAKRGRGPGDGDWRKTLFQMRFVVRFVVSILSHDHGTHRCARSPVKRKQLTAVLH